MSPQDQLADAPEKLRRQADWMDSADQAGALRDGRPVVLDLHRWADAIEAERNAPTFDVWKLAVAASLYGIVAYLWGWLSAGGPL